MTHQISQPGYQRIIDVIQRANQIAMDNELDALLDHMLDLFVEVAGADAGTLYLYDTTSDELIFKVVKGDPHSSKLLGTRFPATVGIAGAALRAREPIFIPDVDADQRWNRQLGEVVEIQLRTMYCLPLMLHERPIGVVQVFNLSRTAIDEQEELAILQLLGNRMVSEIEKARLLDEQKRLLEEAQRREQRLKALVEIISSLTTTLDRKKLLTLIMERARELIEVEATSVWELDEQRNVLVLHVATGNRSDNLDRLGEVTVRVGEGLIGECVEKETIVHVEDVRLDPRHNKAIDRQSGFETRDVLTIPLRAPGIQLGPDRGELRSSVIGGAQALNKRGDGTFTGDDIELFKVFASQAATVLQLARLYEDTQKLFEGVIKVVTGAIDAKDPYTQGHSQRVSYYSVAIAKELGLPQEEIYHIKIGGLLHDVGKIGVSDAILRKAGRLTDEEFEEIKKHPTIGERIMSQKELKRLLSYELPALAQHHERLDGRGYPFQLAGDQISQIGRIVAVADVFDALTSDRPYHAGRSAEEAFAILRHGVGAEFDPLCVEALIRARAKGEVLTQAEWNRTKQLTETERGL